MVDRFKVLYVLFAVALVLLTVPAMYVAVTVSLRSSGLAILALYLIPITALSALSTTIFIVDHLHDLLTRLRQRAEFWERIRSRARQLAREVAKNCVEKNVNMLAREILCRALLSEAEHSLMKAFQALATSMKKSEM